MNINMRIYAYLYPRDHWDSTDKWEWREIRKKIYVLLRAFVSYKVAANSLRGLNRDRQTNV